MLGRITIEKGRDNRNHCRIGHIGSYVTRNNIHVRGRRMSEMTDEQKIEILDGAIKAYEDRERLEIENEKLKAEINELKYQCAEMANKIGRNWKEKQLKMQMSAVEVLEWIKENDNTKKMEDVFGIYQKELVLYRFTSQEIVEKIIEYEKKNHFANDEKMVEPQFKVGDWVMFKPNGECGRVTEMHVSNYFEPTDLKINGNWRDASKCEHAEPPKEANDDVEWVWEVHGKNKEGYECSGWYHIEDEAIKCCERKANEGMKMTYSKVCIRKESHDE